MYICIYVYIYTYNIYTNIFLVVYCNVLRYVVVCCSVLQCVAVYCSVLQCIAMCCGMLWCVAVYCSVFFHCGRICDKVHTLLRLHKQVWLATSGARWEGWGTWGVCLEWEGVRERIANRHWRRHQWRLAMCCSWIGRIWQRCDTVTHCNTLQHTATHCNTLFHTATQCNTLQHTATHCNTLEC